MREYPICVINISRLGFMDKVVVVVKISDRRRQPLAERSNPSQGVRLQACVELYDATADIHRSPHLDAPIFPGVIPGSAG